MVGSIPSHVKRVSHQGRGIGLLSWGGISFLKAQFAFACGSLYQQRVGASVKNGMAACHYADKVRISVMPSALWSADNRFLWRLQVSRHVPGEANPTRGSIQSSTSRFKKKTQKSYPPRVFYLRSIVLGPPSHKTIITWSYPHTACTCTKTWFKY